MAQKHLQERKEKGRERKSEKYQNVTDKSGQTKVRDDKFWEGVEKKAI